MATTRMDQTGPQPFKVSSIVSDKGTIRKVSQDVNSYHVITDGIRGVKGVEPKLLYYARTPELDVAFAARNFAPFAKLVSETVGECGEPDQDVAGP